MRRDILELDASPGIFERQPLQRDDVESIRLLLSGASVVDWNQVHFSDLGAVDRFLGLHLLDMSDAVDRERLSYVFHESVDYLEEHLKLHIPSALRKPGDVREIFLHAGRTGRFRRNQILSCAILKLMHVIHHMEVADLRHKTAMSEEALSKLAHARMLSIRRQMREDGLPVASFYGSRKSRSSVITKLLAKKDNVAATIFDKLRFRIVVPHHDHLIDVLRWLVRKGVPFNYVIPGQSHNNLLSAEALWGRYPQGDASEVLDDALVQTGKNEFSGATYRMINAIVDVPVRVPEIHGPFSFELGRVVYVMVEIQLLDEHTAQINEQGDNAHYYYKDRQRKVVARRLKRGSLP